METTGQEQSLKKSVVKSRTLDIKTLKAKYEAHGLLAINLDIEPELIDQVAEATKEMFQGPNRPRDQRVQDGWMTNSAVKALALHPKVLKLLKSLYNRRPLPFQTLNFPVGTQQPTHSDTIHFNSKPSGFMCGVWFALEDIDVGNGPLMYYQASHKLKEITMEDVGCAAEASEYRKYEIYVQKLVMALGLAPSYGLIKKGECIIWAANLLHGGAPQLDTHRPRLSQVTHYFFDGCEYFYTPMVSTREKICFRNPVWIE